VVNAKRKYILLTYILLSIAICMWFPIIINHGIRVDLRLVPIIIGGLYFGSSFLIAGFALLIRAFIGIDTGFWITLILVINISLLQYLIKPYFDVQSVNRRISISIIGSFFASFLFIKMIEIFQGDLNIVVWMSHISITVMGAGIISYALETIDINWKLRGQVLKTKKLEALSQMGAAISHEIRNPLTSARGLMQFLREDSNLEEKQTEYIDIAISELDQAEMVIANYLAFSKPSMERVEELNVRMELEQVIIDLMDLIDNNQIQVKKQFNHYESIHGDKKMLHQCFKNVIENCIDAMPAGGSLSLETTQTKCEIMISISDTGYGMSDDQLDRLGEPYYLINEGKGTGLGMMLVHSFMRAMNGSIDIKSKLDEGTTFHITFPINGKTRTV
jgi:two-component system, sporulation sensor kinase B